jgi:hypothetical protein
MQNMDYYPAIKRNKNLGEFPGNYAEGKNAKPKSQSHEQCDSISEGFLN